MPAVRQAGEGPSQCCSVSEVSAVTESLTLTLNRTLTCTLPDRVHPAITSGSGPSA